ncbi:septum site-determining protein MinC [Thiorhodococcus minor]|uniref:Probable septum site-determining protein MinC n=1 Tax=Thiorhodococcus minor TaxID=57489 RepID=A0A6M0JVD1_9GAMM|nr:septum site-determining protein MinC [Thiorhodococcus minor]NEV61502.1 septum site-determining protein MinC [Thiorhodococcus minor]
MAVNSSSQNNDADGSRSFELKAASFTLPIIRLMDNNVEAVAARLGKKVEKAPHFFRNTPVVIDLSGLAGSGAGGADLPLLVGLLRGYGMIPFGVRGGSKEQHAAAEALELAVLRDSYVKRDKTKEAEGAEPEDSAPSEQAPQPRASQGQAQRANQGFLLVTRPVRSGQRVYAAGGDLSITAAVSSGAELMADGNIHVYGPLRGRALAGMSGNLEARIFCQDLQAELVSIAGHYRVSENIPSEMRGVPVQIFLDQKVLRIEKL